MRLARSGFLIKVGLAGASGLAALVLLTSSGMGGVRAQTAPGTAAPTQVAQPEPPPPPVVLTFGPGRGAYQRGWVMFTRQPRMRPTTITVELAPEVMAAQSAIVFQGQCSDLAQGLGPTVVQLTDVMNGESITTVDMGRSSFFAGGMALAIQGSDSDPSQFTACVNLPGRHLQEGGGPGPRPPV